MYSGPVVDLSPNKSAWTIRGDLYNEEGKQWHTHRTARTTKANLRNAILIYVAYLVMTKKNQNIYRVDEK